MVIRKRIILILGKDPTQRLDDTILIADKEDFINFTEQQKKFCLRLHYIGVSSYLFVNGVKIKKFKANNSEINAAPLRLGDISKKF